MVSDPERRTTRRRHEFLRRTASTRTRTTCATRRRTRSAEKFDPADKKKLDDAIGETIKWLDVSAEASKEEYEEKQKELEAVVNPIMQKLYGAAGGMPGGMPGAGGPPADMVAVSRGGRLRRLIPFGFVDGVLDV